MRLIRAEKIPYVAASHEDPNRAGVLQKKVLCKREELPAGRVQMLNWARLPAGSSFRKHYHEDMSEVFVVVSGRVLMSGPDQQMQAGPGDTIVVAAREVHSMKNLGAQDAEYIVFGITQDQGGKTIVVEGEQSGDSEPP